tara:strand:+ start:10467 stop:10907 length:441 start_codon:yes stop_codon:yes gene_type:complete
MILISHRGNVNGKISNKENAPYYVNKALNLGYHVEVDVRWYKDSFYLGHDEPIYKVEIKYLQDYRLWCHAKNLESLIEMKKYNIHCFWHQRDDATLTSNGYIWVYPGKQPVKKSIAVLPEIYNDDISQCIGVCSDIISNYKKQKIN